MKSEKIILFILKAIIYVLVFGAAFLVLGAVGSYEEAYCTFGQFITYMLISSASIILAYLILVVRTYLKNKCIRRIKRRRAVAERGAN
jgi:uncharacterized membrane protein